jgi:hypothetical protein
MAKKKEPETKPEFTEKRVCEKCGLVHEVPIPAEQAKADDWKMIVMSIAGIAMIAFIWVWVFKWGVPLVKHLSQ